MLPRTPSPAALAVALTTPSTAPLRGPRAESRRAFRHAGQLPPQPIGVEVLAAVAQARATAGREHPWDARLEASLLAVHGYLWRRGRGEKWAGEQGSSRYACSIAQLVMGLAPIMGWRGIPDARDLLARGRFVKRHRKSVQRWLMWLERAGLIVHTPQQDEEGFWWRTIVELAPTPALEAAWLTGARRRRQAWTAAEARREARGRQRNLTAILRRARLTRAQRRARAVQRRRDLRVCQDRLRVRELLARSLADAATQHLTHPCGASPTSRGQLQANLPPKSAHRGLTRAPALIPGPSSPSTVNNNSATRGTPGVGEEQRWAIYREVTGIPYSRTDSEWEPLAASIRRRVDELAEWPTGRACPRWRLIEAWAALTHSPVMAAAGGTRLAMWSEQRSQHGARLDRALARYARAAAVRPDGWPESPIAAFVRLLARHSPPAEGASRAMAYDVQRFNELTKQMSAYAHVVEVENAARAQARARRRVARTIAAETNGRLAMRLAKPSAEAQVKLARDLLDSDYAPHRAMGRQLYAAAQRREEQAQREAKVLAGADPWPYDGRYRAAVRYAERWGLRAPYWTGGIR